MTPERKARRPDRNTPMAELVASLDFAEKRMVRATTQSSKVIWAKIIREINFEISCRTPTDPAPPAPPRT